jgi:hypothetical protein
MEAYAIVAGDPTTGANQSVTGFAARKERRFLANRRCPKKDCFEKLVGTAATTWYGRGAMACKSMADNIRSQCVAFTAKRKCVLDKLTTGNLAMTVFSTEQYTYGMEGFWTGISRTALPAARKSMTLAKPIKLEAVYKQCVKDPQIVRFFPADIRALARMPVAVVTPARETQGSEVIHAPAIADVRNRVDAIIDAEGVEAGRRPEGQKSAKRARRNEVRAVMRCGSYNRDELCHNGVGNVQDRVSRP